MLVLNSELVAGPSHGRFAEGETVAAIIFVAAETIDDAENMAATKLRSLGWVRLLTSRHKEVAGVDQFEGNQDAVAEAYRDACAEGVGIVIFPESRVTPLHDGEKST